MSERPKRFKDFYIRGGFGSLFLFGGWDTEKMSEPPLFDLGELYAREMESYFNGKEMKCTDCYKVIVGPRDLRRYYGASLHHECLLKRREKDVGLGSGDKNDPYWSLITKLFISEPDPQYAFEFPPTASQFHHGRASLNTHSPA